MTRIVNAAEAFAPSWGGLVMDVLSHGHVDYWIDGGRGSLKSSTVSMLIVLLIIGNPRVNAIAIRRYASTLRSTVFEQMLWAIGKLGVDRWFKLSKAPLEITYLPTGQKIAFVGLDDPRKSKGTVFPVGYSAIQWFEECDEINGWEAIQGALRTFRRGNGDFWTFYTYNPPRSRSCWVNQKAIEMDAKPDAMHLHTTYLDIVGDGRGEWLGSQFLKDAEYEERVHPQIYLWEFLGEQTGTGGELFGNVYAVQIDDERFKELGEGEDVYDGLDFGYEHPMAWIRVHYDPDTDTLTPLWEHVERHANLGAFLAGCEEWKAEEVICDSAEPDRIADMRSDGWHAVAAVKRWGQGRGRAYSWEWLRTRAKIEVDPRRTPNLWHELSTLEFERLKDGTYSSRYPDLGEDCVMAMIYGLNRVIMRGEL